MVDPWAAGALPDASGEVAELWERATSCAVGDLPSMGLHAGDRPCADVDVLAGAFAAVEYEVARRMHAAMTAGSLPLIGPGAVLSARGWSSGQARRLARTGALAADHPTLAASWAAGIVTSEHVDAVARNTGPLSDAEVAALIGELAAHWGHWSPAAIARFVTAAARMLHPPEDPDPGEADAHDTRNLSFSLYGDTVLLSGTLPRLEGEAVIAAIDALAEKLRSTADHVPAGARRADALVELVNAAAANGILPTRGGLPVALTVTLDHTTLGDPVWSTSRGHHLTPAEQRFTACDPTLTSIAVTTPTGAGAGGTSTPGSSLNTPSTGSSTVRVSTGTVSTGPVSTGPASTGPSTGQASQGQTCQGPDAPGSQKHRTPTTSPDPGSPAARIAALAALLFDGPRIPLAVGRTSRTATPAQRKALATRDGGCIIPGCQIPAENCQAHHLTDWSASGATDLENLALVCWSHHRQVDLGMWTITPAEPGTTASGPPPGPPPGAPPGTPWPANNHAPFTVTRTPRTRWRL